MTNKARPSEVAMGIARGHVDHDSDCHNYRLNPDDQDDAECELVACEFKAMSESLALAITSAIADAVRKEAEECAKAMAEKSAEYAALIDKGQGVWPGPDYVRNDTWVDWGARRSAFEQAERAIRARHTTDSKEQPR